MKIVSPTQMVEIQLKELRILESKAFENDFCWEKYWDFRKKLEKNIYYKRLMEENFYKINPHLKNKI